MEKELNHRSILIDDSLDDPASASYGLPWDSDGTCFNFNFPQTVVRSEEISKITDPENIITIVIGQSLQEYSFVSRFKNLQQLYIYDGNNINDLDFLYGLVKLRQLLISHSHISSLMPLVTLAQNKIAGLNQTTDFTKQLQYPISGICIDTDQLLDNIDQLFSTGLYIKELIINGRCVKKG